MLLHQGLDSEPPHTEALSSLPDPTEAENGPPLLYRLARVAIVKNITLALAEVTSGETRMTLRDWVLRSGALDRRFTAVERSAVAEHTAAVESSAAVEGGAVFEGAAAVEGSAIAALVDSRAWPVELPMVWRDRFVRRSAAVAAALQQLGRIAQLPDGMARLEVLLMETIDVVARRADAWMSGLAHRHLLTRRAAGERGLRAGWYGLLERPGSDSATATVRGYLQTPSAAQAATAAMLHAGHQRLRADGAFDIDLTSRRVRQAMRLVALLQRGMAPAQALGLRAQRYLHDRDRGDLVVALRDNLPPRDPETDQPQAPRAVDGLALIDSDWRSLPRATGRSWWRSRSCSPTTWTRWRTWSCARRHTFALVAPMRRRRTRGWGCLAAIPCRASQPSSAPSARATAPRTAWSSGSTR
jgi:hypothetical protein